MKKRHIFYLQSFLPFCFRIFSSISVHSGPMRLPSLWVSQSAFVLVSIFLLARLVALFSSSSGRIKNTRHKRASSRRGDRLQDTRSSLGQRSTVSCLYPLAPIEKTPTFSDRSHVFSKHTCSGCKATRHFTLEQSIRSRSRQASSRGLIVHKPVHTFPARSLWWLRKAPLSVASSTRFPGRPSSSSNFFSIPPPPKPTQNAKTKEAFPAHQAAKALRIVAERMESIGNGVAPVLPGGFEGAHAKEDAGDVRRVIGGRAANGGIAEREGDLTQ
ncbi:hypothetical protein PM082_022076 [Marasmius tenuissimus]|nr:hypothetical protein PM082_022076 [Marasmius tenuissimus]